MEKNFCNYCRHFSNFSSLEKKDVYGECKYNPPVIFEQESDGRWPVVHEMEWCSKWEEKW
jgi:ketosteroid isomerase-like protein